MLGLAVISSVMLSFGYSGWRLLFGGVVVWGIGDGWYNDGDHRPRRLNDVRSSHNNDIELPTDIVDNTTYVRCLELIIVGVSILFLYCC